MHSDVEDVERCKSHSLGVAVGRALPGFPGAGPEPGVFAPFQRLCGCRSPFVLVPAIPPSRRESQVGWQRGARERRSSDVRPDGVSVCFAWRFLGSLKATTLRRRGTISSRKHTQIPNGAGGERTLTPAHWSHAGTPGRAAVPENTGQEIYKPSSSDRREGKQGRNNASQKMFFPQINPKHPPAGSHFSLQMNRFRTEKQQQMPQRCSAGS